MAEVANSSIKYKPTTWGFEKVVFQMPLLRKAPLCWASWQLQFENIYFVKKNIMQKLVVLLLFLPTVLTAQKNVPALLDSYMQAHAKVNEFTGTVLVAQKGKVIYKKAFGYADREWKVPNTLQTKFQVGSITKQFTAACILQLAGEGKLSSDDYLNKYFPDFPKGDSVTIHMLLTHTSGIKSYTGMPEFWKIMSLPIEKDTMVAMNKMEN